MVAFTSLHGGHHVAPQYRNSGLLSALAFAKAASTSPVSQAITGSACAAAGTALAAADFASGVAAAVAVGASGVLEHAPTSNARARAMGRKAVFIDWLRSEC